MKTIAQDVDARTLAPAAQARAALEAFDRLPVDGSFVLVADRDLWPVYDQIKAKYPDSSGWVPVSAGPPEWKAELRRLAPKDAERGIAAYFARDHDEIDAIFTRLLEGLAAAAADPGRPVAPLKALRSEFDARLERHIRWEEEILFPAVEAKAPHLAQGPGRVMRDEHVGIRELKRLAAAQLSSAEADRSALRRAREAFLGALHILVDHNRKEEGVYYPMSDEMLLRSEAAELLKRVREMR